MPPDPNSSGSGRGALGAALVWRPLLAEDGLPALAETAEFSPEGASVRCVLRPQARFSDGTSVTAADVVAAVERAPACELSAVAVHPLSVELCAIRGEPVSPVLRRLLIHAPDRPELGTGPYRIAVADADVGVVLVREPQWWAETEDLPERVELLAIEDPDEASVLLRDGHLDIVTEANEEQVRTALDAGELTEAHIGAGHDVQLLAINSRRAPFVDPAVRRAVATAIDRRAVVAAQGGFAVLAPSPVRVDPGGAAGPGDPRALRDARVTIRYNHENPVRARIAELVARDLRVAGMGVDTEALPWATLTRAVGTGDFDLLLTTWSATSPAALRHLWHSGGTVPGTNPTGLHDETVDRALDALSTRDDAETRGALAAALVDAMPAVALTAHPEHLVTALPGAPLSLLFGSALSPLVGPGHGITPGHTAVSVEGDGSC